MRMTSTHIPVAAAAGLLALLAAPASPRAGAGCPPTAVVEGAAEIVTPIAAVLRRRGVGPGPSDCGRVVRASLAARPNLDTYALHIEDGYGRVSDREVADAGTAASLIESWAIDEDADVLAPRVAPVATEIITAAAPAPDAPPRRPGTWTPSASSRPRPTVRAGTAERWRRAAASGLSASAVGSGSRATRATSGVDFGAGGSGGEFTGSLSRTRYGGAAMRVPAALPGLVDRRADDRPRVGPDALGPERGVDRAREHVLSASAEAGIGVAGALSAHWSRHRGSRRRARHPVSNDSDAEALWGFAPSPPRGLVSFGIGVRHAR